MSPAVSGKTASRRRFRSLTPVLSTPRSRAKPAGRPTKSSWLPRGARPRPVVSLRRPRPRPPRRCEARPPRRDSAADDAVVGRLVSQRRPAVDRGPARRASGARGAARPPLHASVLRREAVHVVGAAQPELLRVLRPLGLRDAWRPFHARTALERADDVVRLGSKRGYVVAQVRRDDPPGCG